MLCYKCYIKIVIYVEIGIKTCTIILIYIYIYIYTKYIYIKIDKTRYVILLPLPRQTVSFCPHHHYQSTFL